MSREGFRVVAPAIFSIALLVAATLIFEWFIIEINGAEITSITFDLREARACTAAGACGTVPMSMIKGSFYPTLAAISFWSGLLFAVLVAYQAGSRVLGGAANESISKAAHGLGTLVVLMSVGAGYLFGPNLEPAELMGLGIDVDRGWGPVAMLFGLMSGHLALYYTREGSGDDRPLVALTPIVPRAVATTRVPLPTNTPVPAKPSKPPVVARTETPTMPPQMRALADQFKGKIRFAMVTGEISVAGIDARREDGGGVLVMWRDVVGLVVRRLPPELDGHPFVDIVSTAGMTLRVLPWSRLIGEHFEGIDDARVRALVKTFKARCPEAKLDRATQAFVDDSAKQPAQLSSVEMLGKHDQALA